jgi:hypothetical protein
MIAINTIIFDSYMEDIIRDLVLDGRKSSAETYDSALKQMRHCFGNRVLRLSEVNRKWVLDFRAYLLDSALSTNSVNTYLGVVRNVYNRAVLASGVEIARYPFEDVFLAVERVHREVPGMEILDKMRRVRLDDQEYLGFSRDLFLFSHYAGGMSFRDMSLLKKKDLRKGRLHFTRSRSGCEYIVLLTAPMTAILRTYKGSGVYLFPIIRRVDKDPYQQYRSGLRKYNIHIRKLADLLDIHVPLNTPMAFDTPKSAILKAEETLVKFKEPILFQAYDLSNKSL